VANIGDCRGVLLTQLQDGKFEAIKMNTRQAATSRKERERLIKEFPNDKDIVYQSSSTAWYVKRRLMPTRAFGDLHLKHEEFNNPNHFGRNFGFKS
jgi:serine/threonine protein phosphatase PrpC